MVGFAKSLLPKSSSCLSYSGVGHDAEFPPLMHDELAAEIFENGRVARGVLKRDMDRPCLFLGMHPDLNLNDLDRRKFRQRFLDGRGVIESVLRPEGSLDTGNGPKSGVAPWRRKTGKRRSRLRLCARERRRSARERRDARSARRPGHKRPCRNAQAARRGSRDTRFPPLNTPPSAGFDLPEKIERSILMQNQEADIASPQVAATV